MNASHVTGLNLLGNPAPSQRGCSLFDLNSKADRSRFACVRSGMHQPEYYREQAQRARRLSLMVHEPELRDTLRRAAQDFDDIAYDLEIGAVEIRHPELLPQLHTGE